jgi:hypothetical protein
MAKRESRHPICIVLLSWAMLAASCYGNEEKPTEIRRIDFMGIQSNINPSQWPILGSDAAPTILLELFDYTCTSCQQMGDRITAAKAHYGDDLSVIVVPVVLGGKNQDRSLELAKLSISLFIADATQFPKFHEWLLQSRNVEEARQKASELVGSERLLVASQSPAVLKYLKMGKKLYDKASGGKLPLLMSDRFVLRGAITDDAALFDIIQQYHALQPKLGNQFAGS